MTQEEFKQLLSSEHEAFIKLADLVSNLYKAEEDNLEDEDFDMEAWNNAMMRRIHAKNYINDLADMIKELADQDDDDLDDDDFEAYKIIAGLAASIITFELSITASNIDNNEAQEAVEKFIEQAYENELLPWPYSLDDEDEDEVNDDEDE